jgi:quinol monooxygenase YgiN
MLLRVLTAVIALAIAVPAMADETLHSVVNVDLMPSKQAAGTRILTDYVQGARKDSTVLSATLVRQSGSLNHFILIQAFATRAAYDSHYEAGYVRNFRSALHPYLGSPWDERLGDDLTR